MKTFKQFKEGKYDVLAVDQAIPRGAKPLRKAKPGKEQKFSIKTQKFSIKTLKNMATDKKFTAHGGGTSRDIKFPDGNIISVPPQAARALLKLDKKMSKGWDQKVKTAAAFNKILKIASKL